MKIVFFQNVSEQKKKKEFIRPLIPKLKNAFFVHKKKRRKWLLKKIILGMKIEILQNLSTQKY